MAERVVTVFGGSGFIGRHAVKRMAARGWRVRIATRHPDDALFLKTCGAVGQIVPVFANGRDDASVAAAVDSADAVVNLVGILYESGRQTFDAVHHVAAARIARAAKATGATRMVQISAIGAAQESRSKYARSKAAGEAAVREAFPGATILRPSVVFGPEDNFFNIFAGLTRVSFFLPLIGGGRTRFQPVYVGDVADAVMAALESGDTAGKTYELGGPTIYTFRQLLELLLKTIDRERALVTVPWTVARLQAAVLGLLPKPLLTRDQVAQLKVDNVVAEGALTLADLGIEPIAAEIILPTYLHRFRAGGRIHREKAAG
ncbi:MAG: complex I NDUFA9 subunit family protein [Inquilinus sp.]|nr:complex I NDUFA9 subunit family protein [Inquilinus sp.]